MYTMQPLTDRQQAILDFIRARIAADGLPPSLAEIAAAFGFAQRSAAHKHLQALAAKGHLTLLPGKARGIRLAGPPRAGWRDAVLRLAVLGRVAAGAPIGADAGVRRHLTLDASAFRPRPDYLLRVEGDSMRGEGILDGDLIAVKRAPQAHSGQLVIARLDDEITVKRLKLGSDRLWLLPANPDYPPIEVGPDRDFAIEGLYCGLLRTP